MTRSPGPIDELACGTDDCGTASEILFDVVAGTSYLIRVGGELDLMTGIPAFGAGVLTVDDGTVTGVEFRRGDANDDSGYDISDAVFSLASLFTPGSPFPACLDSADSNDDGGFDTSDAIYTLAALFTPGSSGPPAPGSMTCGVDPTTSDSLDCAAYTGCP